MTTNEAIAAAGKVIEALEELQKENAELKRLLKLAMKDIQHLADELVEAKMMCGEKAHPKKLKTGWYDVCTTICVHSPCDCYSPCDGCCDKKHECQFEWRYSDEVKGLIENGNELDTVQ